LCGRVDDRKIVFSKTAPDVFENLNQNMQGRTFMFALCLSRNRHKQLAIPACCIYKEKYQLTVKFGSKSLLEAISKIEIWFKVEEKLK